MKIKVKPSTFEEVETLPPIPKMKTKKPSKLLWSLIRVISLPELWSCKFSFDKSDLKRAGKGPYLILMNHSCFLDLKIANRIFYPMTFMPVCTCDGFVGQNWLMRNLGCIPTKKFIADINLIWSMMDALNNKKTSVLLFPEAGYSLDGRPTVLQKGMGKLFKKLGVPVVMVKSDGAFLHDPLYNKLQLRKVKVTAKAYCLLTKEEIASKSVEEMDEILAKAFDFDAFKTQIENKIVVDTPTRADGLHSVLYKCPNCGVEGQTHGEGTTIKCNSCGKEYSLSIYGEIIAKDGDTNIKSVPEWMDYQRECVKNELINGDYNVTIPVKVKVLADYKCLYDVGSATLTQNSDGLTLKDNNGKVIYNHSPLSSYSLNVDYFWYEMGDMICIGEHKRLYYCFPENGYPVTKSRLVAEELFKLKNPNKSINSNRLD